MNLPKDFVGWLKYVAVTVVCLMAAGNLFLGYGYGLFHDRDDIQKVLEERGYEVLEVNTSLGSFACDPDWQNWDVKVSKNGTTGDIDVCMAETLIFMGEPDYAIYGEYEVFGELSKPLN